MKSFKKIAMVTAAALTSTMFITTASNAAPLAVTVAGNVNVTTSAAPQMVQVPSTNVIDAARSVAIAAVADAGTVVTFSATGVKLVTALNTVDAPKTVASGVPVLTGTSTGTAITVYAYTTSTSVGYVTIVNGSYSTVVYIKGIAGSASNVGLSVPSGTAVNTVPTVSVLTTDVFGNPVGGESVSVTVLGTTLSNGSIAGVVVTSSVTDTLTGAVTGTGKFTLAPATAGDITIVANGLAAVQAIPGLAAPTRAAIAKFSVADYAAELDKVKAENAVEKSEHAKTKQTLSDAQAEILKLKTDLISANIARTNAEKALAEALAKSTADVESVNVAAKAMLDSYKAKYNALATKWNKANPKSKVALIK